jgi:hypothetical protein
MLKHHLATTFVVLEPDQSAALVAVTPTVFEELGRRGATLVLEDIGSEELTEPGAFVVVPKGTWHTARTAAPTRMLFITPGERTENRPL